jgi:hypothetical protein
VTYELSESFLIGSSGYIRVRSVGSAAGGGVVLNMGYVVASVVANVGAAVHFGLVDFSDQFRF